MRDRAFDRARQAARHRHVRAETAASAASEAVRSSARPSAPMCTIAVNGSDGPSAERAVRTPPTNRMSVHRTVAPPVDRRRRAPTESARTEEHVAEARRAAS